jgi:hypothetical protein
MLEAMQRTPVGRIMSSFVLRAHAEAHADVRAAAYASGWRGLLAHDIAGRCLAGRKALASVAEALLARGSIFSTSPTTGALGARLVQNTPDRPLPQQLLIAQGMTDDLVLPALQARFVARRCADGQSLDFRRCAGQDHLSVVATDSPLTADLIRWTQARLDGVPTSTGCRELSG